MCIIPCNYIKIVRLHKCKKKHSLNRYASSGKTTIGQPLAKTLNMGFIDTDRIIMEKEKRPLRDIVNHDGWKSSLRYSSQL